MIRSERSHSERGGLPSPLQRAFLVEASERAEDLLAEQRHVLAGARELDAPALREHHRRADRLGETAQQPRDRRLRKAELLGCARDAAQAQASFERDELWKQSVAEIASKTRVRHGRLHQSVSSKVSLTNRAARPICRSLRSPEARDDEADR